MKSVLTALLLVQGAAVGAQTPSCDRSCMSKQLDRYLSSIVSRAPDATQLGSEFRATENGLDVKPGEGLWKSATGLGPMQRRYFDTTSHQAAFYGLVHEPTGPALLSLRIKFDGAKIVESEAIVARKGEPLYNPASAVEFQPRPGYPLTAAKPSNRDSLQRTATAYFNALGGGDPAAVPGIKGCDRVENGTKVTNRSTPIPGAPPAAAGEERGGDCTSGLNRFAIAEVAHRRFPVIDTEAGVSLGVGLFHRPPGAVSADGTPRKRNLIHEYFAMDGGRIAEVFAVMRYRDHNEADSTGW